VVDASAVFAAPNSTVEDKGIGGKLKGLFGGKEDGKKDNTTEAVDNKKEEKGKDVVRKLVVNYEYGLGGPLTREDKWASRKALGKIGKEAARVKAILSANADASVGVSSCLPLYATASSHS